MFSSRNTATGLDQLQSKEHTNNYDADFAKIESLDEGSTSDSFSDASSDFEQSNNYVNELDNDFATNRQEDSTNHSSNEDEEFCASGDEDDEVVVLDPSDFSKTYGDSHIVSFDMEQCKASPKNIHIKAGDRIKFTLSGTKTTDSQTVKLRLKRNNQTIQIGTTELSWVTNQNLKQQQLSELYLKFNQTGLYQYHNEEAPGTITGTIKVEDPIETFSPRIPLHQKNGMPSIANSDTEHLSTPLRNPHERSGNGSSNESYGSGNSGHSYASGNSYGSHSSHGSCGSRGSRGSRGSGNSTRNIVLPPLTASIGSIGRVPLSNPHHKDDQNENDYLHDNQTEEIEKLKRRSMGRKNTKHRETYMSEDRSSRATRSGDADR